MLTKVRSKLRIRDRLASLELTPTARRVRHENLTYLSARKMLRLERAARSVADVPGDFAEFGVALGGSAIVLAEIALNQYKSFRGFDVFGMIPAPTSEKDNQKAKERYQIIAEGKSEGIGGDAYYGYVDNLYDRVKATFSGYGLPVDGDKVALYRGLFEDSLDERGPPISFAHIDCDWYDPVKLCLERISARMTSGGVIILDDYHDYGGAKIAVDEFLGNNRKYVFDDGVNVILRLEKSRS
jgi:O-methyltransferase